jgi:hypothetical protein
MPVWFMAHLKSSRHEACAFHWSLQLLRRRQEPRREFPPDLFRIASAECSPLCFPARQSIEITHKNIASQPITQSTTGWNLRQRRRLLADLAGEWRRLHEAGICYAESHIDTSTLRSVMTKDVVRTVVAGMASYGSTMTALIL